MPKVLDNSKTIYRILKNERASRSKHYEKRSEVKANVDLFSQLKKLSKPKDLGKYVKDVEDKLKQSKENTCQDCKFNCENEILLRQHILVEHLRLEPERYQCLTCDKVITEISEHIRYHQALYFCHLCGEPSSDRNMYYMHVKIHSGESWPCDNCDTVFISLSNLNTHKRIRCPNNDEVDNNLPVNRKKKRIGNITNNTKITVDSLCGFDTIGGCVHFDLDYKYINVFFNSKSCDTSDLKVQNDDYSHRCIKIEKICNE